MRFLKTNTATRITVGPFLDKTDGITPEVALTVTSCKLTLMVDTAGVPTLILDVAPTASGGANDMVHVTGDDAGFYDLELAAADVNYVGRAMLAITDAATHCPVFHEFMILSAQAFEALCGTGNFSADVIALSGDATAADNAEAFFDGTGYAGTNNVIPSVTTVTGNVNGSVGSVTGAVGSVTGAVGSVTGAVGSVTGAVGSVTGAVGSVTAGVTVTTNNDKTGYALSTAGVQAIWDALTSALTTVGSVGKLIVDNLNGAVDTVLTRLGSPSNLGSGATVAANLVDIEGQTDDIGAAGAGLTAVPWNATWDAEVQSEVDDALVAQRLDELVNADSDIDGLAPPTVGSVVHELMSKTAGSFTFDQTTDSLEAIRDKSTDIETDTAEIGAAGAGLTNINLPDQTMNITGNITGNLSGSVGSVTGAVGSVTGLTAANLDAAISTRATPAQVNTEVLDVLNTDTFAEPGQETPGATVSLVTKIGYLFKAWRNKSTQTSTTYSLYNDDGTTVGQTSTRSDDGATFTDGEKTTGA